MKGTLLSVRDLSVTFSTPYGDVEAAKGVSFEVNRGETVALVGESGSGKSVCALSILQLLPYQQARHPSGSILFDGIELMKASGATLREVRGGRIGIVFQEPMTSLNPLHRVGRQVSETLILHKGLSQEAARERVLELLEMVGIKDPAEKFDAFPHELSGGQRQRVMIAMALANEPDLLIADEPTTALDVTIQAQILSLLKELGVRFNMAVLLITHDLSIVEKYADKICVMTEGEIVESGSTAEIFGRPRHPYTIKLLGAEPTPKAVKVESDADPLIEGKGVKVWFPIKRGLLRRVSGYVKAVEEVDLKAYRGRTLGIVGESGCGKTTLALALARLIHSDGEISLGGKEISRLAKGELRPLRRRIQIVFQDPFGSLSPRMSVRQIVEEGLLVHKVGKSADERDALVVEALRDVGMDPDSRFRYPHEFSGGQRQRIAIARALVLRPEVLILDEPTSALDRSVQTRLIELLRKLQHEHNLTYLFISHDLKVVRALSDEIIVMREGRIIERGSASKVFEHPSEDYTKELLAAALSMKAPLKNGG
ncbi:MAG: microcin ABC transporter ATP-binding protein [Deltaproteobacteria bacterium]|nr:MAG: microcin ABC transporter ATP-binding protein [Deltaproteobacteria bacterium]